MSFRLGKRRFYLGYEAVAAIAAVLVLDRDNRIILCVAAAGLHELGHLCMMGLFGVKVRGASLRLFDVRIYADSPRGFYDDLCITLGGPAVNLLLAAALAPAGGYFGRANLALGCFNLLPVASLDGGRLASLLLQRRYDAWVSDRVLTIASFIVLLPLLTAGIFVLLRSGYNYSLLVVSLYLTAILLLKK